MNTHPVEAHKIGDHYTGHFYVIWRRDKRFTVRDDNGNPVRFPSWEKAVIAAYQARDAAEDDRYTNWNNIDQKTPVERWWNLSTRKRARQQAEIAAQAEAAFRKQERA
jgi:hypothetical protein